MGQDAGVELAHSHWASPGLKHDPVTLSEPDAPFFKGPASFFWEHRRNTVNDDHPEPLPNSVRTKAEHEAGAYIYYARRGQPGDYVAVWDCGALNN